MNMFKKTIAQTPDEYIEPLAEPRKSDFKKLFTLIKELLPEEKPFIISGMIGFIPYHYKYASGREGDWSVISLANQKHYISLYICAIDGKEYVAEKYKHLLPKASVGKSCIRIKKLEDIDVSALREVIQKGIESVKKNGFAM